VVEHEASAFTDAEKKELARMGHALKQVARPYGVMQAITWDPATSKLEAAADPRGVGTGEVKLAAPVAPR
jgi:gamma-glutamyltranspeptidase/glutathione hydrolase